MGQFVYRFILGGLIVSLFAVIGDVLRPKSFAGLFGAAPSVGLATLSLTILANGKSYAALEARSMIAGAVAFIVYAYVCMRVLKACDIAATKVTICGLVVWLVCAVGAWLLVLR